MLAATWDASFLRSMLSVEGMKSKITKLEATILGLGFIRAGKGTIGAGQDF